MITNPISFLSIKNLTQGGHGDKNWRLPDHFAICRVQKKLRIYGSLRKNVMIQKKLKDRRIQHYFVWMAFPDQPENASFPSCVSFKIDNFVFWKSQCSRIRLYHFLVENSSKGDKPSKTGHYRTILLATIDVPWTEKLLYPGYFMKDVLAQKFSMTECRWNFWPSKSQLLVGGRIKTKYPDGHSSA